MSKAGTKLEAGRVAVVTGAASGIGMAISRELAVRGLRLALVDIDEATLRAAHDEFAPHGSQVLAVQADVSVRDQVAAVREQVDAAFGHADLLFNNAGIFAGTQPVWEKDPVCWRRLFEINYWGAVYGIQAFIPGFIERGTGHVINTASLSGMSIVPGLGDYAPAKHALVSLSEILRADLDAAGHERIGVTLLCPAIVDTPMGRSAAALTADAPRPDGMIGADDVAAAAMRSIEAGDMYVMPTPRSKKRILDRLRGILHALPD
jgi:NAD(P)-dependent dehydrogenase (short-subunit alcohol dehydrogenase family)